MKVETKMIDGATVIVIPRPAGFKFQYVKEGTVLSESTLIAPDAAADEIRIVLPVEWVQVCKFDGADVETSAAITLLGVKIGAGNVKVEGDKVQVPKHLHTSAIKLLVALEAALKE